jgi:hypothetical protein
MAVNIRYRAHTIYKTAGGSYKIMGLPGNYKTVAAAKKVIDADARADKDYQKYLQSATKKPRGPRGTRTPKRKTK